MRKFAFAVTLLFLGCSSAWGQTKSSGTAACGKPSVQHAIPVGDRPDHSFSISQTKCNWTKPMTIQGVKNKEGMATQFDEISGNTSRYHGYWVDTMADGDKGYYTYKGTATLKNGMLVSVDDDRWTLAGGTGKLKGLKASGTCKGKGSPDGSATWECEGTYTPAK